MQDGKGTQKPIKPGFPRSGLSIGYFFYVKKALPPRHKPGKVPASRKRLLSSTELW
jgi:hypothetical protein